ncbi:hypothetical protein V5T82_17955 [Magnetovibrio sp. PR-2]|uniref:hypothetical protein n=1 Tax=Magnetovibrio sp. PR-2 TaxID=3120356 RepID=UPI002FCE0013
MIPFARHLAFAVCVLFAAVAFAVLPPEYYMHARAHADHHIQIEIHAVQPPAQTPGGCEVSGRVVTVFRSQDGILKPGSTVSLEVDCTQPGDNLPVGPVLWHEVSHLVSARFMEVYLDGEDVGTLDVAFWQSHVIDGPSQTPHMPQPDHGSR